MKDLESVTELPGPGDKAPRPTCYKYTDPFGFSDTGGPKPTGNGRLALIPTRMYVGSRWVSRELSKVKVTTHARAEG